MTAEEAPVLYAQDGAIVTVTLNRPEVMNNFGGGLFQALGEAATRFHEDDSARVMILTGRGRAFCAGADLKAIESRMREGRQVELTPEQRRRNLFANPKFTRHTDFYKPMIGAINGYCFAGGLEVALTCHFLIGAESSEYGVLNRRRAVPLVDGGTYRLPLYVGLGNALYLIQTGARIHAREAHRIGLIQEVVPDGQLMDRVRELAAIMAAVPHQASRVIRSRCCAGSAGPMKMVSRSKPPSAVPRRSRLRHCAVLQSDATTRAPGRNQSDAAKRDRGAQSRCTLRAPERCASCKKWGSASSGKACADGWRRSRPARKSSSPTGAGQSRSSSAPGGSPGWMS
jgi:enoyl-CoA hydratase